jgi:outer membrane receptor for ferrienterochelin and colicin
VFARTRWMATEALSLDAELAAEASRITVSGDARQSQSFSFFKPSVALTWRPSERLQWQLGARRRVGQLSFGDFAASASLTDSTAAAGNPDLGPDQATRYYASLDFRGNGDLAANVEVFLERRQDVLEQVLLPSGGVGLANAGEADYDGLKTSLTLPLNALLNSARLSVDAEYVRTDFADPLIDSSRRLSRVYTPSINTEFRHDPVGQKFSWGLSWTQANTGYVYRVDEIDRVRTGDALGAFIETGAFGPFRTRLALRNIGEQRNTRERRFFDPDRGGELNRTETRAQRSPLFLTLTFSASF